MRILIDYSDIFSWPLTHLTGIQRVIVNISIELTKLHHDTICFFYNSNTDKFHSIKAETLIHSLNSEIDKLELNDDELNFKGDDKILLLGGSWVTKNLISKLTKLKKEVQFEIFHFIHDVTCIRVPHVHRDKSRIIMEQWLEQISYCTDHYLTNSQFSKKEILSVLNTMSLPKRKFSIIRLGDEPQEIHNSHPTKTSSDLVATDYILCTGSFEPRKNHILLYYTWKMLFAKHNNKTPTLVIVGSKGWLTEDIRSLILRDPDLKPFIQWKTDVKETELNWLYENCKFSIYPSTYEGWGLPVAESLSRGKLCLTSSLASMPEIAGNIADYFNPYNSQECMDKVEEYFFNEQTLKEKEKEIEEKYKITTWRESAIQCLDAIKNKR